MLTKTTQHCSGPTAIQSNKPERIPVPEFRDAFIATLEALHGKPIRQTL